jgi:hypothetical protein
VHGVFSCAAGTDTRYASHLSVLSFPVCRCRHQRLGRCQLREKNPQTSLSSRFLLSSLRNCRFVRLCFVLNPRHLHSFCGHLLLASLNFEVPHVLVLCPEIPKQTCMRKTDLKDSPTSTSNLRILPLLGQVPIELPGAFSGLGLMVPGRQVPNSRQESAQSKQSAYARNSLSASGALAPLGPGSAAPLSRS